MRTAILIAAVLALVFACPASEAGTAYGSAVTVPNATAISDILSGPSSYIGKTVKIQGLVVDVCSARGCWMELAGDKPYQKLRVKVEDGVIVFPVSARGRQASVQGVVEVIRMCPDEALQFRKQEAAEKGVPFRRSMVTGTERSVSIRATGAVID